MGMVKALELYLNEDHEALWKEWQGRLELHLGSDDARARGQHGLLRSRHRQSRAAHEHHLDSGRIALAPKEVSQLLLNSSPSIVIGSDESHPGLVMNSFMLQPGENKIVAEQLARSFVNTPAGSNRLQSSYLNQPCFSLRPLRSLRLIAVSVRATRRTRSQGRMNVAASRKKQCALATDLLDVHPERSGLSGSRQHFNRGHLDCLRLSPQQCATGLGLQRAVWGYALFQTVGGRLADRVGPRRVLAAGVIWWGIFTALTAAIPAGISNALILFIATRFLLGAGEAVIIRHPISSSPAGFQPRSAESPTAGSSPASAPAPVFRRHSSLTSC